MKKYRVSKLYVGIYLFGIAVTLIPVVMMPYSIWQEYYAGSWFWGIVYMIVFAFCLTGMMLCIYNLFFDFPSASFTIDDKGIRLRMGMKRYSYLWKDFIEYNFIGIKVDRSGNLTYWIYCSQKRLSNEAISCFFQKTRKELDSIMYFQYNKEPFEELLRYVPEEWAQRLRKQEDEMLEHMRIAEKLYHK